MVAGAVTVVALSDVALSVLLAVVAAQALSRNKDDNVIQGVNRIADS